MYFIGSSSTRAIAKFLWDRKNFKISNISIYNWIKGFGSIFKEISKKYLPKNLSDSDEWHVDETVIKIQAQRYYIWAIIDSETRFAIDWYLTQHQLFIFLIKLKICMGAQVQLFQIDCQIIQFLQKLFFQKVSILRLNLYGQKLTIT